MGRDEVKSDPRLREAGDSTANMLWPKAETEASGKQMLQRRIAYLLNEASNLQALHDALPERPGPAIDGWLRSTFFTHF